MNTTHLRTLLAAATVAFTLCSTSPLMAAPSASLSIPIALPGATTTAEVTLNDVDDIESFTLTLDFAPGTVGTVLTLPVGDWFSRGTFFPAAPFGTAPTVELNNVFDGTARTRVFIDGFKPTGTVGNVGTVSFMVDAAATAGTTQQVSLTGEYLSKSGAVVVFAPVTKLFTVSNPVANLLTVSLAGSGGGSVNSDPAGIACTSGSNSGCTAPFPSGFKVELFASSDWKSVFSGWSGGCSGTGACSINPITVDTGVTALFTSNSQIKNNGSGITYASLEDAYSAANDGETLLVQVYSFPENLLFDLPKNVTLNGGKDSDYVSTIGRSTIQGVLRIKQGGIRVQNIVIR